MRQQTVRRIVNILIVSLVLSLFACGCSKTSETKVILTTGFAQDEIFKIEEVSATLPELMVYMANIQDTYEQVYGEEIWQQSVDGVSMEDSVRNMALAKLSEIKTMVLLAERRGLALDEEDITKAGEAADAYYSSLSKEERELLDVDEELIREMYEDYALAEKLYESIIADVNPQISDDEARTITVEHILIKTYDLDDEGNMVQFDEAGIAEAEKLAEQIHNEALEGADFDDLASKYSDDENHIISFGKGEMDTAFEEAAFSLGTDEISDVVRTEYGFHIIKCISTFNKEVTDENKVRIVEERKKEAFSEEYDAFAKDLVKNLNEELFDSVTLIHDDALHTGDFFEIYDEKK